ncbi:MAG: hypothetical protein HXY28_12820 [Hydrogenophilaceae bacterium]|jgi:hypothetical protein|nr:hypothetical protein [Hydrogenophilaceae bacterium]
MSDIVFYRLRNWLSTNPGIVTASTEAEVIDAVRAAAGVESADDTMIKRFLFTLGYPAEQRKIHGDPPEFFWMVPAPGS